MKFRTFILLAFSICTLGISHVATACGPSFPEIPDPEFFRKNEPKRMNDYFREENLRLWQSQTSENIPLSDIEQVVYKDSNDFFRGHTGYKRKPTNNLMYIYLRNTGDYEVCKFLNLAKAIEKERGKAQSPWYYPRDRSHDESLNDYHWALTECKEYDGERFKDRYALQAIRVLLTTGQCEECIEYFNTEFSSCPNSNLMKRMAMRYVAGCWERLGDSEKADSLFAITGDIWNIGGERGIRYMIDHNPNAPQITEYIRSVYYNPDSLARIEDLAHASLHNKKVMYKGDWAFILAYLYGNHRNDFEKAASYIAQAQNSKFSTDEVQYLTHVYKMKIDACRGTQTHLLADLKRLESKLNVLDPDAPEWGRRIRNIIYLDWVPGLWQKKDYPTAILLAAYADKLQPRVSEYTHCKINYGSLSFQMMGSLTSKQLIDVYEKMKIPTPLYNYLRGKSFGNSDYYNELIGTLALREENYSLAVTYLSKVSEKYQRSMNIYRYLASSPFVAYPTRWYNMYGMMREHNVSKQSEASPVNAKLTFARRMLEYQKQMNQENNSDEKARAMLMYAIGRRNSFEECWALTQYWRGYCVTSLFYPFYYYRYDSYDDAYSFLFDYERNIGHEVTELRYQADIAKAMKMFRTNEARAEAEYLLGNLKNVIRKYPHTSTAQFIKTSCDNWRQWL